MKIKLLIADENALFRELLADKFTQTPDIEVVAEACSSDEIFDKVHLIQPDIVLTEVAAPGLNGVELAGWLHKHEPSVKLVALTRFSDKQLVKSMLEAGTFGFINKDSSFNELSDKLRQIFAGKKIVSTNIQDILINDYLDRGNRTSDALTKREQEILKLLAEGFSIKDISEKYFISIKTAGTHKQNIFTKMGFENMAQLVKYALKCGIVS